MAPAPADPEQYRRTQRRRAWIGWGCGILVLVAIVVAGIAGGGPDRDRTAAEPVGSLFDYHLTSRQFDRLELGESETAVVGRLGKVGLPEGQTNVVFVALFPLHDETVNCSYWEISDAAATVVQLCFSTPEGILSQKLARDLSAEVEAGGASV